MSYVLTPTAFNPASKGTAVTLSGGDLSVSVTNEAGGARTVVPMGEGLYYFEVGSITGTLTGPAFMRVGFSRGADYSVNTATLGESANSFGWDSSGAVYCGGSFVMPFTAYSTGDVVGLLVDMAKRKLTGYVNGVVAGTYTNSTVISGASQLPTVCWSGDFGTSASMTANFGASAFTYPVPANAIPGVGSMAYTARPVDDPDRFVFRSTDFGAPPMVVANGGLINVLKYCLTLGYGDKAPAGWTMPFTSGSTTAVFKQGAGGNDRFFRIVDSSVDGYSMQRANIRGYETMSAVSTGTNPFPTTGQFGGNGPALPYGVAPDAAVDWTVVATSSFVHIIAHRTSTYQEYAGFGTFHSDAPGDTYNNVVLAGADEGAGYTFSYPGGTKAMWVERSDSGAVGSVASDFIASGPFSTASHLGAATAGVYPYPDRMRNSLQQFQPYIYCDGALRGRLPGLWDMLHNATTVGPSGTKWQGAAGTTLAGKKFELFGSMASAIHGNAIFPTIEISGEWS